MANIMTVWQDEGTCDTRALHGDGAVCAVIAACALENPVLALVNNFLVILNARDVALVQLVITLAAVGVIAVRRPRLSRAFVLTAMLFLVCVLAKFIVTGQFNPRFLYDAAMLPLFLALGACAERFSPRFFGTILVALLVAAIVEVAFPDIYAMAFNPRKYFYYTRDWVAAVTAPDAAIDSSTDFYLGANRYAGSFLASPIVPDRCFSNRCPSDISGSSAPSSRSMRRILSVRVRALLVAGCFGLAYLSDTRVALFLIVAAIALRDFAGRAQLRWLFAVPFGVLLGVVVLFFVVQALPGDPASVSA